MRDQEFSARLRAGAETLAAVVTPPSCDLVRRRGDRRRTRAILASGMLAFMIGAGGGGAAYASLGPPSRGAPVPGAGAPRPFAAAGTPSAAPPRIVAVTTAGAVEVLDVASGIATAVLVRHGDGATVIGDEIAVAPSGATVYYAIKRGCADSIEAVPVAGGAPRPVAAGVLPAISPDGTKLAFVREPVSGGPRAVAYGCEQPGGTGRVSVVVRDLASGRQKIFGASAVPISHLSWSPSGQSLLVSAGPGASGAGWALSTLDVATGGSRDIPVSGPPGYYREGVFLPGGGLFVDRVCCAEPASKTTRAVSSTTLLEIDAAGGLVRQVAIGYLNRDHTSLDASGAWLLYLSAHDLFVADGAARAHQLTGGLIAAAWLGA